MQELVQDTITVPDVPPVKNTDKFSGWWDSQEDYVRQVLESFEDYDYVELEAPTGSGKTVIAMSVAHLMDAKTYYLVSTKSLQQQLINDHPEVVELKGRNNFTCLVDDKRDVAHCPYKTMGVKCPKKRKCPYYVHKELAKYSQFVTVNYPMFLVNQTFVGDLVKGNLIICDEAHTIESELNKFVGIKFTYKFFHDIGLTFPGGEDYVMERIEESKSNLEGKLQRIRERCYMDLVTGEKLPHPYDVGDVQRYQNKLLKIKHFLDVYEPNKWVMDYVRPRYDQHESYVLFKPIIPKDFGKYIFDWADKVLFMSATFPPTDIFARGLGVNMTDLRHLEMPSVFPKENRPVVYEPVGRMSYNNWDDNINDVINWLIEFTEKHSDEKIMVHCVSYKNLHTIVDAKEQGFFDIDIIYHESSEDRDEMLQVFKDADYPVMFLSPSMETGVDLPYDECRRQVIMKVPYLSLGDKQTKVRMKLDKRWYLSQAIMRVVQAAGRIVRAKDDYGVTYVIDECFADLVNYNRDMFPNWFLEAIAVRKDTGGDNNEKGNV